MDLDEAKEEFTINNQKARKVVQKPNLDHTNRDEKELAMATLFFMLFHQWFVEWNSSNPNSISTYDLQVSFYLIIF